MKQWYLFYSRDTEKLAQFGRELSSVKLQQVVGELQSVENKSDIKLQQAVGEILEPKDSQLSGLDFPALFALVPWGHHIEIIAKCKTVDEALFYVSKSAAQNWSRATLMNCIKSDLYHTSGGAVTNFADRLPSPQSELAQAITKDTYDFGFLTLEEGYQEEALETELEKQLTRFLLELGTGFSYLGRQKQIVIAGKTRKLDMPKISYAEIVDSTELIGDFGVANLCLRRINDTLTLNHTAINVEKEGKETLITVNDP